MDLKKNESLIKRDEKFVFKNINEVQKIKGIELIYQVELIID